MSQDVAGVTGAGVEVVFQLVPLTSYSSPRKGLGVPPLALQVLSLSPLPPPLPPSPAFPVLEGFPGKGLRSYPGRAARVGSL